MSICLYDNTGMSIYIAPLVLTPYLTNNYTSVSVSAFDLTFHHLCSHHRLL